jgi:hypothetical protein
MTRIASVQANQPVRHAQMPRADTSAPATFTRKSESLEKTVKDKAIIPPAVLARELNTQFSQAGRYYFQFGGANQPPSRVERFGNGLMCISGAGDRVVTINNGEITDSYDHISQADISAFLSAAKNAR